MAEPTTYTLTLSPDYVLEWGLWEAVRELLQNSLDQCNVDADCKSVYEYRPTSCELIVGTTNCTLSPKCLLLGATSKRDNAKMVGQFGEGFKLALLVLKRLSYDVVIKNDGKIWRPSFEYSEQYDARLLTITIEDDPEPERGVYFHIRDVSPANMEMLNDNYLSEEPNDKILTEEHLCGRVFVSGLFVCKIPSLGFGYNFAPGRIELDRDRGMASSFEVTCAAGRLWERSGRKTELYESMKRGDLDTQYVSHPPSEVGRFVVDRYLKDHPAAIPVCSQEEMDRLRGCKTQLVSRPLRDLLRRMHSFVFDREGTPEHRLEAFAQRFHANIGTEGKREFDAILEDAKGWT